MNNCAKCEQALAPQICDLPAEWQKAIVKAVCISINTPLTCDDVKECETLTSLSPITADNTAISMTFTDENHKKYVLSMDFTSIMKTSLDHIDPQCFSTIDEWADLTNKERIERIINSSCNC